MSDLETAQQGADFAALLTELREELRGELGELRKAFVERPEPEPEAEPNEAEQLSVAAKRAGLSVGQYRSALKAGRRSQFKEEYGDTVRELLDELLAEPPAGEKTPPLKDEKPAKEEKPADDSSPLVEHWSTRRFSELFDR